MNLGRTLKYIRFSRKMTQLDVAELAQLSVKSYCFIEKGYTTPSDNTLNAICQVLNVDKTILYFYSLEMSDSVNKEQFKAVFPKIKALIQQVYPELP